MLPLPSTVMEPGSVFSVDDNGTPFRIGAVPAIHSIDTGQAGFPSYSATSSFSAGFLVSTMAALTSATGRDAQLGANVSNSLSVTTSYSRPDLILTEGQPEGAAIAWFRQGYRIEPHFRYFLVREALRADNVAYEIKHDDLAKLNGEAAVKDMVKGKFDLQPVGGS